MISKISGTLIALDEDAATLDVGAFQYEVLVPQFASRQLHSQVGASVSLHTLQYLEGNPTQGRLIPRLIGFGSEVEREFFQLFCSVDGVGMRKALRAMVRPVQDVASLIEEQDAKGLSTLPGIGPATSERIIAKLRRKMSRFALLISDDAGDLPKEQRDVAAECLEVLVQLGHVEVDARKLIDDALASKKRFADVDTMIQQIYDSRKKA